LSLIADVPLTTEEIGMYRLLDMAVVIRSKDAGINRLTFDIIFTSAENYEAATPAGNTLAARLSAGCRAHARRAKAKSAPA
jgi:Domain of unknown function (DUF4387)